MIPSRVRREGGKMKVILANPTSLEKGQMMMQVSELQWLSEQQFPDLNEGGAIQVVGRLRVVGGGEGEGGGRACRVRI